FLPRNLLRAEVAHGGGLDDHACALEVGHGGVAHLTRGLYVDDFGGGGRLDGHGARDQNDVCSPPDGSFCQRVPHPAAAAVADVAHRVNGLARRSGGDEDGFARQVLLRSQNVEHGGDNGFVVGQAARSSHAAGQVTGAGI